MIYYGVWTEVHGGVTGTRYGWLKTNGEYKRFDTLADAEREAAKLTTSMNGPNAKANFQYTAAVLGDTDADEMGY